MPAEHLTIAVLDRSKLSKFSNWLWSGIGFCLSEGIERDL